MSLFSVSCSIERAGVLTVSREVELAFLFSKGTSSSKANNLSFSLHCAKYLLLEVRCKVRVYVRQYAPFFRRADMEMRFITKEGTCKTLSKVIF